jgi:methyl halide transferase
MTDWNQRYLLGDTPWEKGFAAPPLMELLERCPLSIWGSNTILVPGCGTGHDVRALASKGMKIHGIDIAPEAITRANAQHAVNEETYELADFLNPSWCCGKSFSAIWEHTCFCAIPPSLRLPYAQACAQLLPPGTHLIGVFFLTPNDPGEEDQGPPYNTSIKELDDRFAPWFDRIESWIPQCAYPGREGREWTAIYRRNSNPFDLVSPPD